MGKCMSCCDTQDTRTQNGHAGNTTPSKSASSSSHASTNRTMFSSTHHDPSKPPLPPPIGMTGMAGGLSGTGTGGDRDSLYRAQPNGGDGKKMFAQYPKLPPIRKPGSSNEGKRISMTSKDFSEIKIHGLFELYRDPDEDSMLADGIERFCSDLEVRPDEFRVLALAWKFEAETMCRFTRNEFVNGCKKLRVDSIKGIQAKFPDMLSDAQSREAFKDLYRWTYKFGLDSDIGQRTLGVDMALSLWKLVFSQSEPAILGRWLDFLSDHPSIRGIPKDTWDMFLNFCDAVGDDLSSYDDTEAWPSLFDDFVEHENDRQNQNVKPDKNEHSYDYEY